MPGLFRRSPFGWGIGLLEAAIVRHHFDIYYLEEELGLFEAEIDDTIVTLYVYHSENLLVRLRQRCTDLDDNLMIEMFAVHWEDRARGAMAWGICPSGGRAQTPWLNDIDEILEA